MLFWLGLHFTSALIGLIIVQVQESGRILGVTKLVSLLAGWKCNLALQDLGKITQVTFLREVKEGNISQACYSINTNSVDLLSSRFLHNYAFYSYVTILILGLMVKPPCGYDTRLQRYSPKTFAYH